MFRPKSLCAQRQNSIRYQTRPPKQNVRGQQLLLSSSSSSSFFVKGFTLRTSHIPFNLSLRKNSTTCCLLSFLDCSALFAFSLCVSLSFVVVYLTCTFVIGISSLFFLPMAEANESAAIVYEIIRNRKRKTTSPLSLSPLALTLSLVIHH